MSSDHFYADLPEIETFSDAIDAQHGHPLPEDWLVLVADVVDSTQAVHRGLYKQVNAVGAATITAVLNAVKPLPVPYVFGGDGATLAIPAHQWRAARSALIGARRMARESFNLTLRIGAVPMTDLRAAGANVCVGRYRLSEHHVQAIFTGGGLHEAEQWVKDPVRGTAHGIAVDENDDAADFSGFECRWRPVPSPKGETVCLLVRATDAHEPNSQRLYPQVLDQIELIYGAPADCRPVQTDRLRLALSAQAMSTETGVRTSGCGAFGRAAYRAKLRVQQSLGAVFFALGTKIGSVHWGHYKQDLVANTDYRKFDDVLREVLSGNADQRRRLTDWLETQRAQGRLVYGIHASPAALLTCLVFDREGDHVHFVDGSDGGYAMAALQLKQQLAGV